MENYINPEKSIWSDLVRRAEFDQENLTEGIRQIMNAVKQNGDKALINLSEKFDGVKLSELKVKESLIRASENQISEKLKNAIDTAIENIFKFHYAQKQVTKVVETSKGVKTWRKASAIEKVGLYIPGGTAPLFSTVLMLAIPAKIAECNEIILCTPPDKNGKVHPAILYAAYKTGINQIYTIGGAQAIAAMAYGTETIPKVYKIFGPGNQYVTKAKEIIQTEGVAIDMPAGPSELLIIADKSADPEFIAADLLSQAEHGEDSQVMLVSDSQMIIDSSLKELESQLKDLPRKSIAEKALKNSRFILFTSMDECIEFSNEYAPEHLIIAGENATVLSEKVINAGSVFLGNYSCESAGDYASGTNHTLPTNGYAKNFSGVSLESFQKMITFQELSEDGLKEIGESIEVMAEAEDLFAHKNAVTIRLKKLKDD
jgi:histidinol dehydrogenase